MDTNSGLDREGRSALHYAAIEGDVDAVADYLAIGLDPNEKDRAGYTPLHFAALYQRAAVVPMLVAAGADVEARDGWGNTALFRAVFRSQGQGDTITALLAVGANPDATNDSDVSPRSLATTIGNYDVAQYMP